MVQVITWFRSTFMIIITLTTTHVCGPLTWFRYCENLIRRRFEQFDEYLQRPKGRRECSMCKRGGAECVLLSPGDYDIHGVE